MALVDNKSKIQALLAGINALPEAGSGEPAEPVLQEKTVSPSTSAQSVTPDSGYDGLSKVTVNAMPTATQATPSISVSSAGLITASTTQSAGYVTAGTQSATKQLTVQAAQTITPGTSDKTIASGRYLTGTQTIKGDSNLVAANIAKGVSIFGVNGTHEGGEDISSETTTYTNLLDDLEDAIDALPEAGSGGGGAVETCNVTVSGADRVFYTNYANGAYGYSIGTSSLTNVACNTLIVAEWGNQATTPTITTNGAIKLYGREVIYGGNTGYYILFCATSQDGGTVTITGSAGSWD